MNTNKNKTRYIIRLAMLMAVMLVLDITPLGYIKYGTIEITTMMIPVMIGAAIMGPAAGAILGAFFGITSFLQCLGIPSLSIFGSTLLGINWFYTLLVCMLPRIAMGVLSGYVFRWVQKVDRTGFVSYIASALTAALTNTILFTGMVLLIFGSTDYIQGMRGGLSILAFAVMFVGVNGLVEAIFCTLIGGASAKVLTKIGEKISSTSKK